MTKQESIAYISSLINDPAGITEGDQSSIALFRQKYPYFIPMRYLLALEDHKKSPWSPAMISAIQSYTGNWILFQAYLEMGGADKPSAPDEQDLAMANEDPEASPEASIETTVTEAVAENHDEIFISEPEAIINVTAETVLTEDLTGKEEEEYLPEAEPEYVFTAAAEDSPDTADIAGEQTFYPVEDTIADNHIVTESTTSEDTIEAEPEPIFITVEDSSYTASITEEQTYPVEETTTHDLIDSEPDKSEDIIFAEVTTDEKIQKKEDEPLIIPIHSQDYFLHQGERISEDMPQEIDKLKYEQTAEDEDKSLMVMMSFSEWLLHFKNVSQKQKEELKDRKALRTMWQKEKLAAAMEEENEEIPENVFEMAVNSISNDEGLISETLANIYIKQEKYDKAVEVYRKLSLRNPQKSVYFARKIDEILKDKQS